jgi:hypothetical protein
MAMTRPSKALLAGALVMLAAASAAAQNGRPFRTLQGQIATLQTQVGSIQQQTASLLAPIQAQLDALSAQVAQNTASIEQLRAYDALVDQKIGTLGGAVLALQSAMNGVQRDVEALTLHDTLMTQWLGTLEQQWRDAEARLAANAADVQRLVEADRALQEYATALQLEVQFARSSAADAYSLAADAQTRLVELRAQLAHKQDLIRGACPAGSAIRQVDAAGNVTCEFDDLGGGGSLQSAETWTTAVRAAASSFAYAFAYCPTGYLVTGGGYSISAPLFVFHNAPVSTYGWVVAASNLTTTGIDFYAVARCVRL